MKDHIRIGLVIIGWLIAANGVNAASGSLAVGDSAPPFDLPDQDGEIHSLLDYSGQKVLVYFYPKDDTPGCTKEACGLRDAYADYQAANIVIFGISFDTPESHQQFREKYNLPFTLLSDLDKKVATAYGTKGVYPLAIRRSFLINEQGRIIKIITDVDVTSHSEDVLRFFREAEAQP